MRKTDRSRMPVLSLPPSPLRTEEKTDLKCPVDYTQRVPLGLFWNRFTKQPGTFLTPGFYRGNGCSLARTVRIRSCREAGLPEPHNPEILRVRQYVHGQPVRAELRAPWPCPPPFSFAHLFPQWPQGPDSDFLVFLAAAGGHVSSGQ